MVFCEIWSCTWDFQTWINESWQEWQWKETLVTRRQTACNSLIQPPLKSDAYWEGLRGSTSLPGPHCWNSVMSCSFVSHRPSYASTRHEGEAVCWRFYSEICYYSDTWSRECIALCYHCNWTNNGFMLPVTSVAEKVLNLIWVFVPILQAISGDSRLSTKICSLAPHKPAAYISRAKKKKQAKGQYIDMQKE